MTQHSKNTITAVALITLFLFYFIYDTTKKRKTERILKNSKKMITICNILSANDYYRPREVVFFYSFQANGKIYKNSDVIEVKNPKEFSSKIISKNFYVLYDSLNPQHNAILITPSTFSKYGVMFPDSLTWVKQYLSKSFF
jgi:hypothetical protein